MNILDEVYNHYKSIAIEFNGKQSDNEPRKPFLLCAGSKVEIGKKLLQFIPKHDIYVEAFLGSGALFFLKPKAKYSILNDLNDDIINLFHLVKSNPDYISRWIALTPFSRSTHEKIFSLYQSGNWLKIDSRVRACGFLYMLQLAYNESIAGLGSPMAKVKNGRHKWDQIAAISSILYCSLKLNRNVEINNSSYYDLLLNKSINTESSFFYFDPPYSMANEQGYYKHNFMPSDHYQFYLCIKRVNGKFMISYDPHIDLLNMFKEYNIYAVPGYEREIIITNYEIGGLKKYVW